MYRHNPDSVLSSAEIISYIEMRLETHKQALEWQERYQNIGGIEFNQSAISTLTNLLIDICGYRPLAVAI